MWVGTCWVGTLSWTHFVVSVFGAGGRGGSQSTLLVFVGGVKRSYWLVPRTAASKRGLWRWSTGRRQSCAHTLCATSTRSSSGRRAGRWCIPPCPAGQALGTSRAGRSQGVSKRLGHGSTAGRKQPDPGGRVRWPDLLRLARNAEETTESRTGRINGIPGRGASGQRDTSGHSQRGACAQPARGGFSASG